MRAIVKHHEDPYQERSGGYGEGECDPDVATADQYDHGRAQAEVRYERSQELDDGLESSRSTEWFDESTKI